MLRLSVLIHGICWLGSAGSSAGHGDTNFLSWLSETVSSAVRTADQHEALKQAIRAELAAVESRFNLIAVQVNPPPPSPCGLLHC